MTVIRALEAGDHGAWTGLWLAYNRFYRAELSEDVNEATFERLVHGMDGMLGLVAVDGNDRPIGLMHLVFHASTWSTHGYCYIEDLFVSPEARGGAAAQDLFDAAFAAADAKGAGRVYWHTQEYNAPARSLYDRIGHRTSFIVYER